MRDYKELVNNLKNCVYIPCNEVQKEECLAGMENDCRRELMAIAADVIEDLLFFTRRLEELRRDGWHLQRTVSDMYGCCIQQMDIPKPPKEDDNA